ncbi:thiamine phosphate synthase [Telluribacter sp. SYSU D00476]|uniref:thiamine phosphate synthase n=1 Tax=Telluribacter sp. SYSU D00476 TaxID=2811430 RepID=UPI001FF69923|nr:thiamine phosphate synthase [Telluribacter sp. SYSU D00476]
MAFTLIGITPDSLTTDQWQLVPALFQSGLSYLYVRQAYSEVLSTTLAQDYLRPFQRQLIIPFAVPDQPYLQHWKEADRQGAAPHSRAFSTSIHELAQWPQLNGRCELVFYSPLFASISKPGYGPALPLSDQAATIRNLKQKEERLPRLIGLGGIHAGTIQQVKEAGFDGAAVLGTLWQSPDPVETIQQLSNLVH